MKTVNHEKFLELVKRLEDLKGSLPGLEPLVDSFSKLGLLMGRFQKEEKVEAKEEAWRELKDCQKKLEKDFSEVCQGWGMGIEDMQAFVNNPMNYSPDEWRNVQEIKTEVESLQERVIRRRMIGKSSHKLRKWA